MAWEDSEAKVARWIARRARERREATHEELRAHAGIDPVRLTDPELATVIARLGGAVGASTYPPSPKAQQRAAKPYLPPPLPPVTVEQELARLAAVGTPQHWTSPLRDELIAAGWVEKVLREDGRWAGDQITAAGLRRLG